MTISDLHLECRAEEVALHKRITELEGRLAEIREIYAGMEGFKPETAPEGYALRIIEQMWEAARGAQEGEQDD